MTSSLKSPSSQALEYISQACFHRRFILPATAEHEELTVTYADVGISPETKRDNVPTIIFIPGMFATRYLGVLIHQIAAKNGVRVLVIDRPGMGGSASVPIELRIPVWLELVSHLLSHLSIDYVALVSHSAGIIYLLNTLFHYPGILYPKQPYIAFLAPWVNPTHSQMTSMQIAQMIPKQAFAVWNQVPRFLLKASPAIESSGAVFSRMQDMLSSGPSSSSKEEHDRLRMQNEYDMPKEVQIELEKCVSRSVFGEKTVGANAEALQCLRKGPMSIWGKCDDYVEFVREFAEMERSKIQEQSQIQDAEGKKKLKVQAYFAESDIMVGKKGQTYFEDCWKGSEDGFQDVFDFETMTIHGASHDSLCTSLDILETIFQEAKRSLLDECDY